jgi:hypothetical protein
VWVFRRHLVKLFILLLQVLVLLLLSFSPNFIQTVSNFNVPGSANHFVRFLQMLVVKITTVNISIKVFDLWASRVKHESIGLLLNLGISPSSLSKLTAWEDSSIAPEPSARQWRRNGELCRLVFHWRSSSQITEMLGLFWRAFGSPRHLLMRWAWGSARKGISRYNFCLKFSHC